MLSSDAGTGGDQGGHWSPQCLADQLTLFQPGRADYPHLLLLAPPNVFHLPASLLSRQKGTLAKSINYFVCK